MFSLYSGRITGLGDKTAEAQFHFADVTWGKIFSWS